MAKDLSVGRASVSMDAHGYGRVVVGLMDISNEVDGVTVRAKAGEPTMLTVSIPAVNAVARGDIQLDEETSKALEALGWTGPDEMLLRRRDLQEALGGLGVVLREWDELVERVRLQQVSAIGVIQGMEAALREALQAAELADRAKGVDE
jgi:hypothetical protein